MTRYNTVDEVVACYTMQVVACYVMPGVVLNLSDFTPAVKKVTRLFGPDREFSVHLRYKNPRLAQNGQTQS